MNDSKFLKTLRKAIGDDLGALEQLRNEVGGLSVFVEADGEIDPQATLEAFRYAQRYGTAPREWDDVPTTTLAEAFAEKVKLDPIRLQVITPGLWTRLWERENGHNLVAALYWGIMRRHVTDSEVEIKAKVRALLDDTPWPLLDEVLTMLEKDEDEHKAARAAVYRRHKPVAPIDVVPPKSQTLKSTPPGAIAQGPGAVAAGAGGIAVGGSVHGGISMPGHGDSLPTRLHKALSALLSDGELRALLFDLGLDYDDLRGEGKSSKALEAVLWFSRRRHLRDLATALERANYSGFQKWFPEGNPF
jgi:hypothetical protein